MYFQQWLSIVDCWLDIQIGDVRQWLVVEIIDFYCEDFGYWQWIVFDVDIGCGKFQLMFNFVVMCNLVVNDVGLIEEVCCMFYVVVGQCLLDIGVGYLFVINYYVLYGFDGEIEMLFGSLQLGKIVGFVVVKMKIVVDDQMFDL